MNVTYEDVRNSEEIRTYIKQADESLKAIGYTEHSFAHCTKVAKVAGDLLEKLGYDAHEVELARIAGFMHDIGNVVNRIDHAQSGAMMAFRILDKMGMPPEDVATVITAIGNHDEQTAAAVNAVAAALIIADKTDVRRSRVRNRSTINFDIHDRVNYAAEKSDVILEPDSKTITLDLKINTEICAVMDYSLSYPTRSGSSPKQCIPFNGFNFMPVNPDQAFFIPVSMDDAEKYEKRSRGTGQNGYVSPLVYTVVYLQPLDKYMELPKGKYNVLNVENLYRSTLIGVKVKGLEVYDNKNFRYNLIGSALFE